MPMAFPILNQSSIIRVERIIEDYCIYLYHNLITFIYNKLTQLVLLFYSLQTIHLANN